MVEANKTYIGVVEDNNDPKRMGRVKVRVLNVFDNIPVDDIPFAMPWKDLSGDDFKVPAKGKVVTVIFDQGNIDTPEYIHSEHYNINLENKLKKLNDNDYLSMKSLIFDHKTQFYVNDSEGLKIDYKYNSINLKDNSLNLNLKDNNSSVNIGDESASQQAILGNHFLDWFDKFIEELSKGSLFNSSGPAIPSPTLMKLIIEFRSLKDLKYLSHHINFVDNNKVSNNSSMNREDKAQYGDNWTSTKDDNIFTKNKQEDFKPIKGPKQEYDKPVDDIKISSQKVIGSTQSSKINSNDIHIGDDQMTFKEITNKEDNLLVKRLISFLEYKGYKVYKQTNVLNIVAMRDKDNGNISNKFDEKLYVFFLNNNGDWDIREYNITTVPGLEKRIDNKIQLPDDNIILAFGQYIDQCELSFYKGDTTNTCLKFNQCAIYKNTSNNRYNYINVNTGNYEFYIKGIKSGGSEFIYDYAKDSQTFKRYSQYSEFIELCNTQKSIKDTFTYTLCRASEFNSFV